MSYTWTVPAPQRQFITKSEKRYSRPAYVTAYSDIGLTVKFLHEMGLPRRIDIGELGQGRMFVYDRRDEVGGAFYRQEFGGGILHVLND